MKPPIVRSDALQNHYRGGPVETAKAKNSAFITRLLEKRALLEAKDPRHATIRTLLLISGGGMRGPYGAGAALALHHLGLADCFDTVIGVSTGAAIGGYFLAGKEQARIGTTIYYEECRDGFVSWALPLPVVHIDFLERVFRYGHKRLDLSRLLAHRSQFYVGITHWDTGNGALVNAKVATPDAIAAIIASLALTYAYRTPILVNRQKGTDGGISEPLPLKKAIEKFSPTDILILSNYPEEESRAMGHTAAEKIFDLLATTRIPASLMHAFHKRDAVWRENMSHLEQLVSSGALNAEVLYGARDVGVLTSDLAKLRSATWKGIADTLALFGDTTSPYSLMP